MVLVGVRVPGRARVDWSNEPYVKVYTRETDDDLALTWEARAVWDRLMPRFDRSGFIETKRGARGIAAATRIPFDVVERVLPELLRDGRLIEVDGGYLAPNYIAAQEASKSDKLRQRDSRERRRARKLDPPVTNRDAAVTFRDQTSRDVTLCSADPLLCVPPARDTGPGSSPPIPKPQSETKHADRDLAGRQDLARAVWDQLEAMRARVAGVLGVSLRPLPAFDQGRTALAMRIAEARDLDRARADCEHVLAIREAEALAPPNSTKWLSGSMFEPNSWRAALSTSLAEAKRGRAPAIVASPPALRPKRSGDDMPPLPAEMRAKP